MRTIVRARLSLQHLALRLHELDLLVQKGLLASHGIDLLLHAEQAADDALLARDDVNVLRRRRRSARDSGGDDDGLLHCIQQPVPRDLLLPRPERGAFRLVYDKACAELRLGTNGEDKDRREHLALLILSLAKGGERDPDVIRTQAVHQMR